MIVAESPLRLLAGAAWLALILMLQALVPAHAAQAARVEARSKTYLAVGLLAGDRMTIHLSRLLDNTPVHDAAIEVQVRGLDLKAIAQPDGSYEVRDPGLAAEGPAIVAFLVRQGETGERLVGTLEGSGSKQSGPHEGQTRQLLWWVLNFAVCIGLLVLISRRRKAAAARGQD